MTFSDTKVRAVVVTGAASGMGAATAQILVDLGAQVTAIDIKTTDGARRSVPRGRPSRSERRSSGRGIRSTARSTACSAAPDCPVRRSPSSTR